MQFSKVILGLVAATVLAAGCAQQKAPADKALDAIEQSLAQIKDDAQKYAPDGLKSVEAQYDRLKETFEKKDYASVLAGTPQLDKAVSSLKDAIAAGKEQAAAAIAAAKSEYANLSTEVPTMMKNIQARYDELSKQKLHIRVTKDELASAQTGLESMKTAWNEATSAAKSGFELKAAEKAKEARATGEEVQKTLGMKTA